MNEDVIQIGSGDEFSEDEDELDLAAVDADLCQLQKRIEKLIDEKVHFTRADFDIFSQGGWRVSQGGWNFFAANTADSAPLRGTSLASSNCRLLYILKIHFLICLGTYFVRVLIRQPWLYSKM